MFLVVHALSGACFGEEMEKTGPVRILSVEKSSPVKDRGGVKKPGLDVVPFVDATKIDESKKTSGGYFEGGGDLVNLEDCIELAFKKHPLLKSALALKRAAKGSLVQVKSGLFPHLSLTSRYSRSVSKNTRTASGVLLPVIVNKTDYYSNNINVNQLIYDFGRTGYRVMAARENLKAAHYDMLAEADNIVFEIRRTYFETVAAEKAVEVNREAVKQQELHLKQARGFYEIGRRSKIEVTKAEVDLEEARLELIKAENVVRLSRVKLANAIGVTSEFNYELDENVRLAELDVSGKKAVEYARKRRPELLRYDALTNVRRANLNLANAQYFPTINGSGSLGYADNKLRFRDFQWGWGISLSFDLFTSGERSGSVREARYNLEALKEQRNRAWQNIYQEVQAALLDLEEARKSIELLQKTLERARENFALAQGRYEVGLSDNLEFNDARVALQRAKLNYIRSVLDYQVARARLEKATGMTVLARKFVKKTAGSPDNVK